MGLCVGLWVGVVFKGSVIRSVCRGVCRVCVCRGCV